MIEDFIRRSVEYRLWGWNIATVGAIGTSIFTFFQGYAFMVQGAAVWKSRSGASLSIPASGFWASYFCTFFLYALSIPSTAMAFNCLLIIPVLYMIAGLWMYSVPSPREWGIVALSFLAVPAMFVFPKALVYGSLLIVAIATLFHQTFEVWKYGPGVLRRSFVIIFLSTCAFWLVFTFMIGNWIIFAFNVVAAPCWIYILSRVLRESPVLSR